MSNIAAVLGFMIFVIFALVVMFAAIRSVSR